MSSSIRRPRKSSWTHSPSPAARSPLLCGLNVTEQAELRPDHLRLSLSLPAARPRSLLTATILSARAPAPRTPLVRCISDAVPLLDGGTSPSRAGLCRASARSARARAALDGSLGETRAGTVDVELDGSLTRGMTVVDWHGLWGRSANADVAVQVDAERPRRDRRTHRGAGRRQTSSA